MCPGVLAHTWLHVDINTQGFIEVCLQNRGQWGQARPWFRAQILARPLIAVCVWGQVTCVSATLFPNLPSGVNNSTSLIIL